MCVLFVFFLFCFVVVMLLSARCGDCISPALTSNSNIFDLYEQCRIVLKFIFHVFVVVFALWLLNVT